MKKEERTSGFSHEDKRYNWFKRNEGTGDDWEDTGKRYFWQPKEYEEEKDGCLPIFILAMIIVIDLLGQTGL